MKIFFFFLFFALCPIIAFSQSILDLNPNKTDPDNSYYIAFCSRTSPEGKGFGHVFIAWGKGKDAQKDYDNSCVLNALGVYPISGKELWSIIFNVQAELKEEKFDGVKVTRFFTVIIDQSKFDSAVKTLNSYKDKESQGELLYNLIAKNCTDFVENIAKSIGIRTPNPLLLKPETYVNQLIDLNQSPTPENDCPIPAITTGLNVVS